jgi:spore coat protein U-like protein
MLRVNIASLTLLAMFFGHCNLSYAEKIHDDVPALNKTPPLKAQFQVKATIVNGCEFDKSSYDLPLTVKSKTTASSDAVAVSVLCTLGSSVTISTDLGQNQENNQRRLINNNNPSQFIDYTLTMSEKITDVGAEQLTHTFASIDNAYTFYIQAKADITQAQAGNYTDTVTFITTF